MSRQARQRRRRHNRSGPTRIIILGGAICASMVILGGVAATAYVASILSGVTPIAHRHQILGGGSTQVFAADGSSLGFIQSDELRTPVSWAEIPGDLKNATVAIEDQRFYKDNGIDPTGIFRAAVEDVLHGAVVQGGSTITMQLMRNLYLGGDQRSLKQKLSEAKLAIEYQKKHSHDSVLTSYLNSVPYGTVGGQTAVGVQAASQVFFDKPVSELNLQQCALLAGLPQAPSEYNPFQDPIEARKRRNEVLAKMAELHYVTPGAAFTAEAAPLEVKHGSFYAQRREDFFFEYVHQQLVHRYGSSMVAEGGLKVYTTIEPRLQYLAGKAISEVLDEPGDPASAIVTINPANGDIEAMQESESYERSQYNLAADGHRQPGSTFKAIDLAEALSRGIDPNSTDYFSHTLEPGWLTGYPTYEVKTFEGTSLDKSINLVDATLTSDNTVYAQLAADLGEQSITQMAYKLGVKTHLSSFPAEALGGLTLGVTPLEMADVYSTLADGGWRDTPIAITKVVFPDGHVDQNWGKPDRVKVLSEGVSAEETSILKQNVEAGTATRSAIKCPTAAKTGTTSELVDAWLDGYTPNYATVVWMGYPNKRVSMTDVHGEPQQGGYLPAEIWHDYMAAVTEGKTCVPFPEPKVPITYEPFFGKFQGEGEAQAAQAAAEAHPKKKRSGHHSGTGGSGGPTSGNAPEQSAPPAGTGPLEKGTGGAGIG